MPGNLVAASVDGAHSHGESEMADAIDSAQKSTTFRRFSQPEQTLAAQYHRRMETIFGLPAHPLMVHFPVVAIPVLALLGLVMVARAEFRARYAIPVLVLAGVTIVSTFLAARSGEELVDALGYTDEHIGEHEELGNMLRLFVLGLGAAIFALVVTNKRSSSAGRDPLMVGATVLVLSFSLLSIIWTVRTGHEGAKAVWEGTVISDDDDDKEESSARAAETDAVVTANGQELYESRCARCHGDDGSGVGRRPSLQGLAIEMPDKTEATEQIVEGGGGMPAFGARLSTQEINAIIDHIYETF